ncbi:hypothetical protein Nham_3918 [Nitrobacter hamburgensis X14]|uniref:Uncharacterized protein n=1 Tax=Nitrobacter hamburgensis (strain DSM 10229 / NCIMB 13809 / X14) TaxID=323097 RepID=Q1QGP0_NITHX|nr:hypothetical protein Nham_3918 [Nitrobacter hamburgensis X14]
MADGHGRPPSCDLETRKRQKCYTPRTPIGELDVSFDVAIDMIWEWKISKPHFSSRGGGVRGSRRAQHGSSACGMSIMKKERSFFL